MLESSSRSSFDVLGVPISNITVEGAVSQIRDWIERGDNRYVCAVDVHSIMRAQDAPLHKKALVGAAMNTPDGQPLATLGQLLGHNVQRVCGYDLLTAVCERSTKEGWRHYFYGGAEGVAEALAQKLSIRFPGLVTVGTDCPPFRSLTPNEMQAAVERIRLAKPDVIWVGLGCPKQEMWMHDHVSQLEHCILIGVGAAFDFHSGRILRAPPWMRDNGLEWLHRLVCEPRRLWHRYLVLAPRFIGRCIVTHGPSIAISRLAGYSRVP